jgi:hypothetical protein
MLIQTVVENSENMQLSRPNMSEKIILKCKDGEGSDPGII